jgi:Fic family protein
VQGYVKAMNRAIAKLDELPFSVRLIKETHKILLQGVRSTNKQPGEFMKKPKLDWRI